MKAKQLISVLLTFAISAAMTTVPSLRRVWKGTGGTNSARYCYSVWMRHMVTAHDAGVWSMPRRVAELGPGDSLGIGLCALLSGAEEYNALDVVEHADTGTNLNVFDELVTLFRQRALIPDEREFPEVKPPLNDHAFPAHLLSEHHLTRALDGGRVENLRNAIASTSRKGNCIRYVVPWQSRDLIQPRSLDYIFVAGRYGACGGYRASVSGHDALVETIRFYDPPD